MVTVTNPIISGFYPDPSICRVDEDYYLVCSSFELYPGIPIFHSKDLANWELIGHALTVDNDFYVRANSYTGGVMAPTIRYHNGLFYIIVMNYSIEQNIIVTAEHPSGPWSTPHLLPDVPGIDASLFFDDDDKAYIIGTIEEDGKRYLYLNEFDLASMSCIGERHLIWDSALRGASAPEAPHLYKRDGYYYLVIAEGGTEYFHAVTVARSKVINGWYEGYAGNPILTHRHLGKQAAITNIGHADLVEATNGSWYAVMLGSRPVGGYYKNLGRETFLCPVTWEDDWPLLASETGKVESTYELDLPEFKVKSFDNPFIADFSNKTLAPELVFWGTPYQSFWTLENNALYLACLPRPAGRQMISLSEDAPDAQYHDNFAFIGCRQRHGSYELETQLSFTPQDKEAAGLLILQGNNHHYRLEKVQENGLSFVQVVRCTTQIDVPIYMPHFKSYTSEEVLAKQEVARGNLSLKIVQNKQMIDFYVGTNTDSWSCILSGADGSVLGPSSLNGMTGVTLGMFATANGKESENKATFTTFAYQGK
ncbi:glycoside hydrolase family 43 protein [Streptococcus sp. S784/96/1]|uniref:glycoside hydrolase family 43 protein n=1 Tax=Streptococcus sp. S784/96/1 TaxID=2653499 RepID=UPI00138942D5|nr:glycoside hydrolase family 43 protein [Streptococcus sp. S784/96/1]